MTPANPSSSEPTVLPEDAFQEIAAASPNRRRRRWLLWLLVSVAALGVLGIGGCLIFSLFCEAKRFITPAEVLQAAHEMTDLELPKGYEGELAETIVTPIATVRKATFRHVSGKGVLSLASMKIHGLSQDDEPEATRSGLEQLAGERQQIMADEESTRTLTIRGEPAEFQLRAGTDTLSSTRYREVHGRFQGKTGPAELVLQSEESIWDADAVERLLDSL